MSSATASFNTGAFTAVRAGFVMLAVVVILVGAGLVTQPVSLASIWLAGVGLAIPLRWTRIALVPEGVSVQRGFELLFRRETYLHDSQITAVQQVLTGSLALLVFRTHGEDVRVDIANMDREALVSALEGRYGAIETLHTFLGPTAG
jgi:hypothetical protein